MTAFYKVTENGFVVGIGTNGNDKVTAITEAEYINLLSVIRSAPVAPDGYTYKLRADNLEWKLVELTPVVDDEASIEDYEKSLSDLGVKFDD